MNEFRAEMTKFKAELHFEERKENVSVVSGKVMKKDMKSLQFQICKFSEIYTQTKIVDIFGQNSDLLFVESEMSALDLNLQKFIPYLEDIKSQIQTLLRPNISEYKQWNVSQMCLWIASLDNRRFKKYESVFRKAFVSDGIDTGDCLPDLDALTLRAEPFNITNFKDRRDLANHCRALKAQPQRNNEGAPTAYH